MQLRSQTPLLLLHDRTRGGGLKKLALTHTPDPIRPIRKVLTLTKTHDSKQGSYDLGGSVRGFWSVCIVEGCGSEGFMEEEHFQSEITE